MLQVAEEIKPQVMKGISLREPRHAAGYRVLQMEISRPRYRISGELLCLYDAECGQVFRCSIEIVLVHPLYSYTDFAGQREDYGDGAFAFAFPGTRLLAWDSPGFGDRNPFQRTPTY